MSRRVSILLAARDQAALLLRCLSGIARLGDDGDFEVVVVDDGSTDETAAMLSGVEGDFRALHEPEGIGWGPAIDRAASVATGEHLVLMREDVVPVDGWLGELLAALDAAPEAGAARPRAVAPDGSVLGGDGWACLAVRREAFTGVGGFAAASQPGRAEKASLLDALRRAGWTVAEAPAAVVLTP